jgi:adenylate cyclase
MGQSSGIEGRTGRPRDGAAGQRGIRILRRFGSAGNRRRDGAVPAIVPSIDRNPAPASRLTADELALRVGTTTARVDELADQGVIERGGDGRFDPGDVHRIRLLTAFDEVGVPLQAMTAAARAGRISLRYYDQLHPRPGPLSGRSYGAFAASTGHEREELRRLFAAFGLAEPGDDAHLEAEDEALIAGMLEVIGAIGQPDLALRAIRLYGESARRAADGALGVYGEAVERSSDDVAGLPIDAVFESVLWPWARFARQASTLSSWLGSRHISRAIDEYSVTSTEQILADGGFVAPRQARPPAVAFVDLTGFTRLTEERGDETAAAIGLRLGDIAGEAIASHGGRVVKLLGDGVLLRFDNAVAAIAGTLDLLAALPLAGLPTGHAGIAAGSLIVRDNDVFGRTVNLAARIADVTPDGRLYLAAEAVDALPDEVSVTAVDPADLQGIGRVELVEVTRAAGSR